MSVRPPADAVVALRSLDRRWRGLFAGLAEDESPDDLAHRSGAAGLSAIDHAARATATLTLLARALERVLVEDAPVLDGAVGDPAQRERAGTTPVDVEAALVALAQEAESLAERVAGVPASGWQRRGRVAGQAGEVQPLDLLWEAVDSTVSELRAAEDVLRETRGRG